MKKKVVTMRRERGQSIVEMAFVMPVLVLILFGIIDISYYIYSYATVYQAARNGAEAASKTPPYLSKLSPALDTSDPCVANIVQETLRGAQVLTDIGASSVSVVYPPPGNRAISEPIEVQLTHNIEPLTPLWQFVMFGNDGTITVRAAARRSIESLGDNPNFANQVACSE